MNVISKRDSGRKVEGSTEGRCPMAKETRGKLKREVERDSGILERLKGRRSEQARSKQCKEAEDYKQFYVIVSKRGFAEFWLPVAANAQDPL